MVPANCSPVVNFVSFIPKLVYKILKSRDWVFMFPFTALNAQLNVKYRGSTWYWLPWTDLNGNCSQDREEGRSEELNEERLE